MSDKLLRFQQFFFKFNNKNIGKMSYKVRLMRNVESMWLHFTNK